MHELRAGFDGDRLHRQMRHRAVANRTEIIFARIFLHQRHQFGDAVDVEARIDRERARLADELRDRRNILARIVGQGRKQQGVDGQRPADAHAQGRAIGRGFGDRIGGEIAAGARLVLDQENAVGVFLHQAVGDQAGDDIGRRARAEWYQDAHGFRRPGLRQGRSTKGHQQPQ